MSVLNPEIEYAERSLIKSFQEKRLVETLEYLSISSDYRCEKHPISGRPHKNSGYDQG